MVFVGGLRSMARWRAGAGARRTRNPLPWLLAGLQLSALLAGCINPHGATRSADGRLDSPAGAAWPLAGTPPDLERSLGLARLAPLLAGPGASADAAARPPAGLGDLVGRALPRDLERLPVPAVPAGPEPLLSALGTYAGVQGTTLPDVGTLRDEIVSLGMSAAAEGALAQLVLAYSHAVQLQRQATQDLSPSEKLLLSGDAQAAQTWLAADAGRTVDDVANEKERIASRIDSVPMLQASDLLVRTIDEVRGPLAIPASADLARAAESARTVPAAVEGAGGAGAWTLAQQLISSLAGPPRTALTPFPPELTLQQALSDLVTAHAMAADRLDLPAAGLPPSLDHAVALFVEAQAIGVRSGDLGLEAAAVMQATEEGGPALAAWSALLALPPTTPLMSRMDVAGLLAAAAAPTVQPAVVMGRSLGGTPAAPRRVQPLADALVAEGMPLGQARDVQQALPPPVATALAEILAAMHSVEGARAAAVAGLPPAQRLVLDSPTTMMTILGKPTWTADDAAVVQLWAAAEAALDPAAMTALDQARLDALPAIQSAVALLASYTLSNPAPPTAPGEVPAVSGPGGGTRASPTPTDGACPQQLAEVGLSQCQDDVWLNFVAPTSPGYGILVTGSGHTDIDSRFGSPKLIIDLGGSDTYTVAAGAANGGIPRPWEDVLTPTPDEATAVLTRESNCLRTGTVQCPYTTALTNALLTEHQNVAIAVDVDGNDTYDSAIGQAQGAAVGLGALGVLWDVAGRDHYIHRGDVNQPVNGAQGFGGFGGLGLLVDGAGSDSYDSSKAPGQLAFAQGTAFNPAFQTLDSPATGRFLGTPYTAAAGVLLDLGTDLSADHDSFKAKDGQGLGVNFDTFGLLFDQAGPTQYDALRQATNQGGRRGAVTWINPAVLAPYPPAVSGPAQSANGPHNSGGIGALIDLGGAGDTYSTAGALPDPYAYRTHADTNRKGDDVLWYDVDGALGFGLDSTLSDEDGDVCPNLVELVGGTDPHNPGDCAAISPPDPSQTLRDIMGAGTDTDQDTFPDFVENATGSDPQDADSTPVRGTGGKPLFDDHSFCYAESPLPCPADTFPCSLSFNCLSLLSLGGTGDTDFDHPALVQIDLGGNDNYTGITAGLVHFSGPGIASLGVAPFSTQAATFSLDLSGNDTYSNPDPQRKTIGQGGTVWGLALLLDLAGDDHYRTNGLGQGVGGGLGLGILADLGGADTYSTTNVAAQGAGIRGRNTFAVAPTVLGSPGTINLVTRHVGGALLDLGPEGDAYTFTNRSEGWVSAANGTETDGAPIPPPSIGLLFDAGGSDSYQQGGTPIDGAGLTPANAAERGVFNDQGVGDLGVFFDNGDDRDLYAHRDLSGALADVSAFKNDVGARRGPGGGLFVDGRSALAQDADGDGVVGIVEMLAGSDPNDPTSDPGSAVVGSADVGGGSPVAQVRSGLLGLPGLLIGGAGDSVYTVPASFMVDLGGNDQYLAAGFGGATAVTGVALSLDVQQLDAALDAAAAGDDLYAPAPCTVQVTQSATGSITNAATCPPTLGAGVGGIGIVADTAGNNTFRTDNTASVTVLGDSNGQLLSTGMTQGAAGVNGVGILATWDSSNRFTTNVTATVTQQGNPSTLPNVATTGIAQGAAVSLPSLPFGNNNVLAARMFESPSLGILANFGAGDDTYTVQTTAGTLLVDGTVAPGQDQDQAQGFTSASGSIGILYDGGGRNVYLAPHGLAQGVAVTAAELAPGQQSSVPPVDVFAAAVGLLWSGTGDDLYVAGPATLVPGAGVQLLSPASQGFARAFVGDLGLLVDLGGSDEYRLAAPAVAGTPASSQAAGIGGILLDVSGDDLYDAAAWDDAQAWDGGVLVDFGGHDRYLAHSHAQGDNSAPSLLTIPPTVPNLPPIAIPTATPRPPPAPPLATVFLNVGGNDAYLLDPAIGFGQGDNGAIFIDTGGDDIYHHAPPARSDVTVLPGVLSSQAGRSAYPENDQAWNGFHGIDAGTLDDAFAAYLKAQDLSNAPPASAGVEFPGTVRLQVQHTDATPVGADEEVDGVVRLVATVALNSNLQTDRVDFLRDGVVLGQGVPLGEPAATGDPVRGLQSQDYLYEWHTRLSNDTALAQTYPDGHYAMRASAFFGRPAVAGVPRPDVQTVDSAITVVALNNPPLLSVFAQQPGFSTNPDSDGPRSATFTVTVSGDLADGNQLTVAGTGAGTPWEFSRALTAAATPITITGAECAGTCADGRYDVVFAVQDHIPAKPGFEATRHVPLLVDGTAPTSRIVPRRAVANATDATSDGGVAVGIDFSDDEVHHLGADQVSGVAAVDVLVLNPDGSVDLGRSTSYPPGVHEVVIGGVTSGQTIRLASVAVDGLGNHESPCAGEEPIVLPGSGSGMCYQGKLDSPGSISEILTDFVRPVIGPVTVLPDFVRPGDPVAFTVDVSDLGTGLESVIIRFEDGFSIPMTLQGDHYTYDGWGGVNRASFTGKESAFAGTVTARDRAGNEQQRPFVGHIDDLAPRIVAKQTAYQDGLNQGLLVGRLGGSAVLRATVLDLDGDLGVLGLQADLSAFGASTVTCTKGGYNSEFAVWACPLFLDETQFQDGDFDIPLVATDRAHNVGHGSAPLSIRSQPLDLHALHVDAVGHDGFTVSWDTDAPGTSQVLFGRTVQLTKGTDVDPAYVTHHVVQVTGLTPSSDYYYQVSSRSQSGVLAASPVNALTRVHTLSALTASLPALASGQVEHGTFDLPVTVHLLAGEAPAHVVVLLQDAAGRGSPIPVAEFVQGDGVRVVSIDTEAFADGEYVIVVRTDRAGDLFEARSATFVIDNTAPLLAPLAPRAAGAVAQSRPELRLSVLDPGAGIAPSLAGLSLTVDNETVIPAASTYVDAGTTAQRTLRVTLPSDLEDGIHVVSVALADSAGNLGHVDWSFRTDTRAPTSVGVPRVRYDPGPAAAKPGGSVLVDLNLTDLSGVAAAALDLTPIGGDHAPLLAMGAGHWQAGFTVPATAPEGVLHLPLTASDGLGNQAPVGAVDVIVDTTAPTIVDAASEPVNYTAVRVHVTTQTPTTLQVMRPGATNVVASSLQTSHLLTVNGLRPNQAYSLTVRVLDAAGQSSEQTVAAATQPDLTAPTTPGSLAARSDAEGAAVLAWTAAKDNSGIDHYDVLRSGPGGEAKLPAVPGNQTQGVDTSAPAGRMVTYRISAVDLAGQVGPAAEVQLKILALPHLGQASITPERGPSDKPFVLQVQYWDASASPATRVEALYGGKAYALSAPGNGSCVAPCMFSASVLLPPTSVRDGSKVVFRAAADGHTVELPWTGSLVVRSGAGSGFEALDPEAKHASPAGGPMLVLAGLATALLLARPRQPRTRRPTP